MSEALRRLSSLWVAILVTYALVLQSVSPSFATNARHDPLTQICSEAGIPEEGGPAGDMPAHGDLCCILCVGSLVSAVLPRPGSLGAPVAHGVSAPLRPAPIVRTAGRLPETDPVVPRGPPSVL